jgi:hypothetical protein
MGLMRSVASGGGDFFKSAGTAVALFGAAAALALLSFGFLGLAGFFALAPEVGPIWAAVIVALVIILLAIVFGVIGQSLFGRVKRKAAAVASVAPMMALAGPLATGGLKRAPALVALALLAAGFFVARSK